MNRITFHRILVTLFWFSVGLRLAVAEETPAPLPPKIAQASEEGKRALKSFKMDPSLSATLFAAEPMLANVVAFHIDNQGRAWVCETFRQGNGVTDNRGHSEEWLDADLAAQTIEDRRQYHLQQLGERAALFTEQDDRIRLLMDTDHDGAADQASVFADRFNGLVEGTGAGVLEHNGQVYYACIPNLWRLQDSNGDHNADLREVLHTGYGIRVAFRGHDLHGLRMGPDGRLYFSIGDRGANIPRPNGNLKNIESGSVFRCDLDGSNLEIFATGLRNPQELAFDDYGNLFTGDNNSDSGDRARWVYVVENGDTGWRMAYQYLSDRGPFNQEKIWRPHHPGQPAYIVPPVANFADGPSGLDYYPGTGFSEKFQGCFFLCDFRGSPVNSGIRTIRVEQDGAFFQVVEDAKPIWRILATDVQFGPKGDLFVSDWVNGWEGIGKGRLYRFVSPEHHDDPIVAEVGQILANGLAKKPIAELRRLLSHADQRVRMMAQFEIVSRKQITPLLENAESTDATLLGRLHSMWGLEQIVRTNSQHRQPVINLYSKLLFASESEIRAQSARLLGDVAGVKAINRLIGCLSDKNQRVRYFALMSLGKLHAEAAFERVIAVLQENDNRDPIIRHGGVMALTQIANQEKLVALASHTSPAVRVAAVVALRRQESEVVDVFLDDNHPDVTAEAARAIHDVPIPAALPALASLLESPTTDDVVIRRALNANYRLGEPEHAERIAEFLARKTSSKLMQLEAIEMLRTWGNPHSRDRVLGQWRPIPKRDVAPAVLELRKIVNNLPDAPPSLQLAIASVASEYDIREAAPILSGLIEKQIGNASQRADAVRSLANMLGKECLDTILTASKNRSEIVRAAAYEVLPSVDLTTAMPILKEVAINGKTLERQAAILALGEIQDESVDVVFHGLLHNLNEGTLSPKVQLETLTAARMRSDDHVKALLEQYDKSLDSTKPVDQYREALEGGNADRGKKIFFEKTAVSCLRCHKVFQNGGEVGPELSSIAAEKDRKYLLESIVEPNKMIAKGFESLIIVDEDGKTHTGVLKEETNQFVELMDANGKTIKIPAETIEIRQRGQSAMPADLVKQLSKSEIRDLVEYLASLKGRRFRWFDRFRHR